MPAEVPNSGSLTSGIARAADNNPSGARYWKSTFSSSSFSGYQFDLDSSNQYTGQLYRGQGRNVVRPARSACCRKLQDPARQASRRRQGRHQTASRPRWRLVAAGIIVRGNTMIHVLNGTVTSITVDDDPVARGAAGHLSLQLEGSGQIWYRNVYLKIQNKPLDFPR